MEDITEIFNKIKAMNEENGRLKSIMGNYVVISDNLNKAAERLDELRHTLLAISEQLDPYTQVTRSSGKREKMSSYYSEIYDKMKSGMQITSDGLSKLYPNLTHSQVMNIMTNLKTFSGVQKRKEGITVILYI